MAKWYNDSGMQSDIVLSTRVRLARNIKEIPFPNRANEQQLKKVIELVDGALEGLNYRFKKYDLNRMSNIDKQVLVEERYISPNMAESKIPSAVYISEDNSVSIMVNEEDHIRFQSIFAGQESEKAYSLIAKLDEYMANKLDYAIHEKYGYLTSCLTNVGTGMRVSYMMHLPAIVSEGIADRIFAAVGKLGVTVRGMYGEGTKSGGYLFQISNQVTLGKSEEEIIENVTAVAEKIISKERELRTGLLKEKGMVIEDKIMRSYGILQNARLMQSKEMMTLLSNIRLGVSLGLIKNIDAKTINNIMIETSPAHITNEKITTAIDRDIERAKIIRNKLNKQEVNHNEQQI